jgi:hypothetical protein
LPHPSHSSQFYHPKNISWRVQIIKLLIMQFSPTPSACVPPSVWATKFHTHTK